MAAMNNRVSRRAALTLAGSALAAWVLGRQAHAHALPGTAIVLSVARGRLILQVQIALHDLALVLPEAAMGPQGVTDAPSGELTTYLRAHVRLTTADGIALAWGGATCQTGRAFDNHVGEYAVLQAELQFAMPQDVAVDALQLHYDAVIHKVRNHKASVVFARVDGGVVPLGSIAYDFSLKMVPPLVFTPGT
jgi:hypothetical protein